MKTNVVYFEEIDSTNRAAKQMAGEGAPEGTLLIAGKQSGGRGRLGRDFYSPEGGIYMTMILRPRLRAEQAVLVTTAAAVAVSRAIEKVYGVSAQIKWVNDIFTEGKKVCGILAEAGNYDEKGIPGYIVLGIGVNTKEQIIPAELESIVGCLEQFSDRRFENRVLIDRIWEEFGRLYEHLTEAAFMEEYKKRSLLLQKTVTVCAPEGDYVALVKDIDSEGHLILEVNGAKRTLSAGEVSIRLR